MRFVDRDRAVPFKALFKVTACGSMPTSTATNRSSFWRASCRSFSRCSATWQASGRAPVGPLMTLSAVGIEYLSASASFYRGAPLPLTQTQFESAVADRAEITRAEAKRVLGALEEIVLEELGNAQKVRIGAWCS